MAKITSEPAFLHEMASVRFRNGSYRVAAWNRLVEMAGKPELRRIGDGWMCCDARTIHDLVRDASARRAAAFAAIGA